MTDDYNAIFNAVKDRSKWGAYSNEQKRNSVRVALRELPNNPTQEIATLCGVSYSLVVRMRKELEHEAARLSTEDR